MVSVNLTIDIEIVGNVLAVLCEVQLDEMNFCAVLRELDLEELACSILIAVQCHFLFPYN